MFPKQRRSNPKGRPSLGANVIGRAVHGGFDFVSGGVRETGNVMKKATRTLVTDPLARVAKPLKSLDLRKKVILRQKASSSDFETASARSNLLATASERWSVKQSTVQDYLLEQLQENFLFQQLSSTQLESLVKAFEKHEVSTDTQIIQEGEPGDYFYILYEGTVRFEIEGQVLSTTTANGVNSGVNDPSSSLTIAPKSFGELALFFAAPRAASVFADTDCILYRLDQVNFRLVVQHEGNKQDEQRIATVKQVPVLKDLDEASIAKLVSAMTLTTFQQGDVLFRKGDPMSDFFIVQSGQVLAKDIEWGGATYQDIVIGPKQHQNHFGWRAMIQKEPIMAQIEALTSHCEVLAIQGETFRTVVGQHDELIQRMNYSKQIGAIAIFRDSCLSNAQLEALLDLLQHETYRRTTTLVKEGSWTDACMTFVRKGKVTLESKTDKTTKVMEPGGYYGQEWMLVDQNKNVQDDIAPLVQSRFTAVCDPHTVLDVLMLEDVRKVINTALLGLGKPSGWVTGLDANIQRIDDITRHKMLGAGSFGQVWLASYAPTGSSSKKRKVYALKVQSKHQLIESHQAEGVIAEVNIMKSLKSPFIIRLYATFQDKQRVFMLTSLLQGGELEAVMGDKAMEDSVAAFYAAGILEGLTYMHRRHIIHRDLKPENVLIDSKGYPVLIDLGFAKYVAEKTYTFCGTPMYIAPEVIQYAGHDKGADYWSWACMVFEMVTAKYPFYEANMPELDLFKKIIRGQFKIYGFMSMEVKLFLINMLVPDPTLRLGARANGWQDICQLSFFETVDFKALRRQSLVAPWVPELKNPLDSSNFSGVNPDTQDKMTVQDPALTDDQQAMFHAFGKLTIVDEASA